MSKSQRNKGARFEREVAAAFREIFPEAQRGRQAGQYDDNADVEIPVFSVECKSRKKAPIKFIRDAMEQARKANVEKIPLVCIKEDCQKPLAVLPLASLISIMAMLRAAEDYISNETE